SILFYLIQSDENIRAIVTTQLIKRKYIDVLPTDEEAEKEQLRQKRMQTELSRTVRSNSLNEQKDYSMSDPKRRIGAEAEHQYAKASESCRSGQSGKKCGDSAPNQRDRSNAAQQSLDSTRGLPPVQASELPLLLRRTSTRSQQSPNM